ncbi:MAG: hypothetical protein HOG49_33495 [Candidatus Scalindua sp.]|jgi:hypothetical protein|nr:hypothetical protein [Candidatus Scalindua sp.]
MKTKKEIQDKLKELKGDERLGYPAATVFANAPLALIQLGLESEIGILKWVLKDKEKEKCQQ